MKFFRFLQCHILITSIDPDGTRAASAFAVLVSYGLAAPLIFPLARLLEADDLSALFLAHYPALADQPFKYRVLPTVLMHIALINTLGFFVFFSKRAQSAQREFNLQYASGIGARFSHMGARLTVAAGLIAISIGNAFVTKASPILAILLAMCELLILNCIAARMLHAMKVAVPDGPRS